MCSKLPSYDSAILSRSEFSNISISDASKTSQIYFRVPLKYKHKYQVHTHIRLATQVSWYEKGKTNVDFTEARDSEWQWHQLGSIQVCTSLQTDNRASTSPLSFYRPDAVPAAQTTASKH